MPQKNTIKQYVPDSFYHVYTRGVNKQAIFNDAADKHYFTSLFERYLSGKKVVSSTGVGYPDYSHDIFLLTYCLMGNHIHLLLEQGSDSEALRKFMTSILTSYSKYFNLKYKRVGSVFESRYKAKRIDSDSYLMHISRYIHMNPRYWETYHHSSLRYVFAADVPAWLQLQKVVEGFKNREVYINFLREYQQNKEELERIKHQLADK